MPRSARWLSPCLGALAFLLAAALLVAEGGAVRRPSVPAPAPPGPPLVLEPAVVSLGRLARGEARDLSVRWRRAGAGALRVVGVVPDCGCLGVQGLPRTLAAGAAGTLRVRLAGRERPGPFTARVHVHTDAGPAAGEGRHRRVTLHVHGHVETEVVAAPPRLELGRCTAGRGVERLIALCATPAAARETLTVALRGLQGTVGVESPVVAQRVGWTLRVRLRVPATPGPFRAAITAAAGARTPVVVEVVGRAVRPEPARADPPGPRR